MLKSPSASPLSLFCSSCRLARPVCLSQVDTIEHYGSYFLFKCNMLGMVCSETNISQRFYKFEPGKLPLQGSISDIAALLSSRHRSMICTSQDPPSSTAPWWQHSKQWSTVPKYDGKPRFNRLRCWRKIVSEAIDSMGILMDKNKHWLLYCFLVDLLIHSGQLFVDEIRAIVLSFRTTCLRLLSIGSFHKRQIRRLLKL